MIEFNPSEHIQHTQSWAFHDCFQQNDSEIQIALDKNLYDDIYQLAESENLSNTTTLQVIFFRYLYGTPACRAMKKNEAGLFGLNVSNACNPVYSGDSVILKLPLPARLSDDLKQFHKYQQSKQLTDLDTTLNFILRRFLRGYLSVDKISEQEGFAEFYFGHWTVNALPTTIHLSESLFQHIKDECEIIGKAKNQMFLDIISEFSFGYVGCKKIQDWHSKCSFSEPKLVPVCNTDDRFDLNEYWGNNGKPVTVNIPKRLNDDLIEVAKQVEQESLFGAHKREYVAQLIRHLTQRYFLGNLYIAKHVKID